MRTFLSALLVLALAATAPAGAGEAGPGVAGIRDGRFVGPDGARLALRGINLGNWFVPEGYMFGFTRATAPREIRQIVNELVGEEAGRRFWQAWEARFVTQADIRFLAGLGLNLIRVPLDYRQFQVEDHPEIWLADGFARLDDLLRWSAEAGIRVILDMHAAPCGQAGQNIDNAYAYPHLYADPACRDRLASVWGRIAARYADAPALLGYDLLNEPLPRQIPGFDYAAADRGLLPVYEASMRAIRAVDRRHLIFLSGTNGGIDFDFLAGADLGPNVALTFHYYKAEPTDRAVARFTDAARRLGLPILLGESGEIDDAWIRTYRERLEANGVDWAFWTYKKMGSTSCLRTFGRPPYWSEIVAYAEAFDAPVEERRKLRPSAEHIRLALDGLLTNVAFHNTQAVPGFARALGLSD